MELIALLAACSASHLGQQAAPMPSITRRSDKSDRAGLGQPRAVWEGGTLITTQSVNDS
jgi:hypothetical protein